MHQNQKDHDRLNDISKEVSAILKILPEADWIRVCDLAQEADNICKKHKVECPIDMELIRSVRALAS